MVIRCNVIDLQYINEIVSHTSKCSFSWTISSKSLTKVEPFGAPKVKFSISNNFPRLSRVMDPFDSNRGELSTWEYMRCISSEMLERTLGALPSKRSSNSPAYFEDSKSNISSNRQIKIYSWSLPSIFQIPQTLISISNSNGNGH